MLFLHKSIHRRASLVITLIAIYILYIVLAIHPKMSEWNSYVSSFLGEGNSYRTTRSISRHYHKTKFGTQLMKAHLEAASLDHSHLLHDCAI